LEKRRLDTVIVYDRPGLRPSITGSAVYQTHLATPEIALKRLHELVFDRPWRHQVLVSTRVMFELLQRPAHRLGSGSSIEVVQPEQIAQEIYDAPLIAVELAQLVLAHREHEVDVQPAPIYRAYELGVEPLSGL
jgi:hypothetical protein